MDLSIFYFYIISFCISIIYSFIYFIYFFYFYFICFVLFTLLVHQAFLKCIEKFDIIGIIETHCEPSDIVVLDGYCTISYCRPKSQLACKPSGGISVFIKKSLKSGIKVAKIAEYSIWLKLCKSSFQLENDIFIAFSYLPPENSAFSRINDTDILDFLEKDITNFSIHGDIIIMGDLNARTSSVNEIILNDSSEFLPDSVNYQPDIPLPLRLNQDLEVNNRGKDLIDLCTTASLRILNGRKPGDSLGHFTCFKYNGSSTVDYGICNEFLIPSVLFFHVSSLLGDLADHCQISLGLKANQLIFAPESKVVLTELPPNFKWSAESTHDFQLALCSADIQARFDKFEMTKFDEGAHHIDKATALFNDIVLSAATQSLTRPPAKKPHMRRTKQSRWFNFDLRKLRKEVFSLGRMRCTYPRDPHITCIRGCYYRLLKIYRKNCKSEHRKFKASLIDSLDKLSTENPSAYWKLVNELTNKKKEMVPIDPDSFYDHYLQLNSSPETLNKASDRVVLQEAEALESTPNFSNLDFLVKSGEIEKVVKSLKNGKSSGIDQIQNEMIKSGLNTLIKPMTKLFNLVFSSGNYPSLWAKGRIISIHKKGDTSNPGNYRGITISSCLGKIFNSVLNNRLCNFLENNNIISEEQIGFRKKHRTSDHLFILKTLIDKYKNAKKSLYIGFIDFMKAFDSVWHTGLLYKILKIGVSNGFYEIVKSMYSKILVAVQVGNSISPYFPSMVGVRQGDNLSPSLFNIFINDLPQIFDKDCIPASFGNMTLSCLLFADDLVVLSESKDGFQRAMNKISDYCSKWHLTVNPSKSKFMCTDGSNCTITYNGQPVECVQSYKYLGLECFSNGNMSEMRRDAYKKALKVYFKLIKAFNPLPRSSTLIHLFDHLVKPVLNYNCEIWFPKNLELRTCKGPLSESASFFHHLKLQHPIPSKLLSNQDPMEKLHLRFLKFCLGLNKRASNMAVYGDLGRHPLYIDQCVQSLNYVYNIEYETNNKILKRFYSEVTESTKIDKNSILYFSKQLQKITGVCMFANRRKSFSFSLRKVLQTDFSLYWKQLVSTNYSKKCPNGGNKLRMYKKFKTIFKQEKYTDLLDFRSRKQIALLRTSSHKLKIETDRYLGKGGYIPPNQRLCTNCDLGATEDEPHFLLDCTAHTDRRQSLFETLSKNPHFSQYDRDNKLWWIMNTEDPEDMKQLGIFIFDSMAARS